MPLQRSVLAGLAALLLLAVCGLFAERADAHHTYLRFPWTYGREGYITRGYAGGTHTNGDYYALDIDVEWAGVLGDVRAAAGGNVVTAVSTTNCDGVGYGNYVDVQTTTPAGATQYARYAHLSSVSVANGQAVGQGQKIGVEGNSGYTINCGAHLHFRWATTQNCSSQTCATEPEPMSGEPDTTGYGSFAEGQTWVSDNLDRPPIVEGVLVKGTSADIYMIDNNSKRRIISTAVFNSCGYQWSDVIPVSDTALSLISTGPTISAPPCAYTIVKKSTSPDIWVIEKFFKRRITGPAAFDACGYSWGEVITVNGAALDAVPVGASLSVPPCPYVRFPWISDSLLEGTLPRLDPNIYAVDNGSKRLIGSLDLFTGCGYKFNDVISPSGASLIPNGSSVTGAPCPYTLVKKSTAPTIYVVQKGFKRPISSPAVLEACGYAWQEVVIVAAAALDAMPTGASLTAPPCPYART